MIQIIQADGRAEQARIAAMRARAAEVGADIEEAVSAVMGAVKEKGLSAVEAYSLKFDGKIPYENPREELEAAYAAFMEDLLEDEEEKDDEEPIFISVTAEDGEELTLEFVSVFEVDGQEYRAFFPAEEEEAEE